MNNKIIKVKCILRDSQFGLTYGKIYDALECQYQDRFLITNDNDEEEFYYKSWFEQVQLQPLLIRYIDSFCSNRLSKNKTYGVLKESENDYKIIDDLLDYTWFRKERFEVVKGDNATFDITQLKSITLNELLTIRGFKTGDIVSDTESIGIVLGDRIAYINTPCQETINPKAYCEFIPIEIIENNNYLTKSLSDYMYYKNYKCLEPYFIQILNEQNKRTIVSVEFVVGADGTKDFILEIDSNEVEVGDVVEVNTGNTYQYARVKGISQSIISQRELENYKTCRKLSEV